MIGPPLKERTAFYCPTCQPGPTPTDDGKPMRPLGSNPASGKDRRPTGYRRTLTGTRAGNADAIGALVDPRGVPQSAQRECDNPATQEQVFGHSRARRMDR